MGNVTKKSHFIWKYYLKSWATHGSIFCSIDGNIPQKTSLNNVANKRYFYKFEPFNQREKDFLIRAIDKSLPQPIISSLIRYIESMERYFLNQKGSLANRALKNIQLGENLMGADENEFMPFLDSLLLGKIDFCLKDENLISFYLFILMQYFRTKKIYDDLSTIEELRIDSVITPLRRILAFNTAKYLYQNDFRTILLLNSTHQEFVTSDQPVCNTCVNYSILSRCTDKLELYYPISPSKAILITSNDFMQNKQLDMGEVDFYNRKIINASQMQVYGSDKVSLERYLDKN